MSAELLKHQEKGRIRKGPRAYVPCARCTADARARDPKYRGVVGTAKQTFRAHLEAVHGVEPDVALREAA